MKLLAFDLDGTALFHHKTISKENKSALYHAANSGVTVVPATGRILSFLPEEILEIPNLRYLICSNGAMIFDRVKEKRIYENNIPNRKAAQALAYLQQRKVYIELYINGKAVSECPGKQYVVEKYQMQQVNTFFLNKEIEHVNSLSELLENPKICPEKINLPYIPKAVQGEIICGLHTMQGIKVTSSISTNLELNNDSATKGTALKWLAEYLQISRGEIMAIGDNENDVEMLQYADISVAIGGGAEKAIHAANYITASCEENGLAKAIKAHLYQS